MNCIDSQVTWENIFLGSALLGYFPRGRGASWASRELEPSSKGSATKDELQGDALSDTTQEHCNSFSTALIILGWQILIYMRCSEEMVGLLAALNRQMELEILPVP